MSAAFAVYHREMLLLRRRMTRLAASMAVSPALYLAAFGYGLGRDVHLDGHSYIAFLLPGLVAMTSMMQAFAIASDINISRFYWHVFDEIQTAPVSALAYVAGETLAGVTRALLGVVVVVLLGAVFGVRMACGPWFWLAVFLNAFVFAALAVSAAMLLRSHSDQMLPSSFVITPMVFLGGTFFPVDRLPAALRLPLKLLPLTHGSAAIRSAALNSQPSAGSLLFMLTLGIGLGLLAVQLVRRARA